MRDSVKKMYWILSDQFGLNPWRTLRAITRLPRFIRGWWQFRRTYRGRLDLMPCLHDWYEDAGTAKGEYFWQDLYIARKIFAANPKKHVDIGSRIDGFVAHVASFREIEVLDVRAIDANVPGVTFRQVNLQDPKGLPPNYCDSLSCLHALEHFGLGRYGDPIDPMGYEVGLQNMVRILQPRGMFYLSVPIGEERVEFNGHRVLSTETILRLAHECGLSLTNFAYVDSDGELSESVHLNVDMARLNKKKYSLGILTFVRQ